MKERITELETRIALADDLLDELNHTIFRQQQQIDMLQAQLRALAERMQNTSAERSAAGDELPPHW